MKLANTMSKTKREDKVQVAAPTLLDGLAKKIVLTLLKQMSVGHLTVEDGGEVFSFGEPQTKANVVAHINIKHASVYRKVLFAGTIGSAEAYMAGHWTTPDLTMVVRVMVLNQAMLQNMDSKWSAAYKYVASKVDRLRKNTKVGSKKNIAAHYDLSNEFFSLFLDSSMMYSSAIYKTPATSLEDAAEFKLDHICKQLNLQPTDHLLEIGTGWGGMAIYAAKHYGCKVTTTTISEQQYLYAKQAIEKAGLENKVTLLQKDYRDLEGQFDKLVSIEMIEAVGYDFYTQYFAKCSSLLKPDGLMLIQAITTTDQRYHREKDNIDFIRKYIFPGGCLPSNAVIAEHVANDTDMHLVQLHDITLDYAKTLADWRSAFSKKLDRVVELGFDEYFIKMWEFYLCYCEGGFKERVINTSQFVFAKPMCRALPRPA